MRGVRVHLNDRRRGSVASPRIFSLLPHKKDCNCRGKPRKRLLYGGARKSLGFYDGCHSPHTLFRFRGAARRPRSGSSSTCSRWQRTRRISKEEAGASGVFFFCAVIHLIRENRLQLKNELQVRAAEERGTRMMRSRPIERSGAREGGP